MKAQKFDNVLQNMLNKSPFSIFHICWERYISKNKKYKNMQYNWGGWYHRDKKSRDPIYFVFRFTGGVGIGTAVHFMIFRYYWAVRRKLVPIIYLEYGTYTEDELGIDNVWEYCFEQMPMKDVLRQKNVYISSINPSLIDSKTCIKLNGNKKDATIHLSYKKEYYKLVKRVVQKYMVLKPEIWRDVESYVMTNLKGFKTLGVALREEFSLFPNGTNDPDFELYNVHPNVPNVQESIGIVQRYFDEWHCDRIFVATLYEESIEKFKEVFGDKVYYVTRKRRKLSDEKENIRKSRLNCRKHEPKGTYYEQTYTYMKEIYILANCGSLMGDPSSSVTLASIINGGEYKNVYFFEDKNHIAKID